MIRTFFVEFVFPCLLLLFLRSIIRNLLASMRANAQARRQAGPPPIPSGGELKRDPVCGTYVSPAASVQRSVRGQIVHFCSKQCSERYAAR